MNASRGIPHRTSLAKTSLLSDQTTTMAAGAVKPAVSYAAVAARAVNGSSPPRDADSSTMPAERPAPKARESKVSFADRSTPDERTALLRQQSASSSEPNAYDADEDDNGEDDDEEQDRGIIARVRRAVGLGKQRDSLPLYSDDGRTQRRVPLRGALGALLGLILVAVIVAGALLVQSGSKCVITVPGTYS